MVSEVPLSSTSDATKNGPTQSTEATKVAKRPHRSTEKLKDHDTNDILDQIIEEAKKVTDLVFTTPLGTRAQLTKCNNLAPGR